MRLIDADALIQEMYRIAEETNNEAIHIDCIVDEAVGNAPAVDAVPVVHGHWILEREPDGKPYAFHCSVCDDDFHRIGNIVASDYCPDCGAKMDGGNDDGH